MSSIKANEIQNEKERTEKIKNNPLIEIINEEVLDKILGPKGSEVRDEHDADVQSFLKEEARDR